MTQSEEVRFLILSTARSGTNLLVDLLNSHPDCLCGYEIFSRVHLASDHIPWPLEDLPDLGALCALRHSDPVALVDRLDRLTRARGYRAVGFKLMYIEAEETPTIREHLLADPGIRVVHVHRRQSLRRLVSLRRAQRTGEWLVRDGEPQTRPPPVRLTLRDIVNEFEYLREQEQSYAALDATHPVLHLTYEDMIVDLRATARELFGFLGLRPWDQWTAGTVKTGTDSLREAIANYDELKRKVIELAASFED